ncbi:MAG: DUF262 domain-containing protein [Candidatus Tumulicola sp.]
MKADPFPIGDVLKDQKQFIVPIYQRTYAWRVEPHINAFFAQAQAKAEERLLGRDKYPHYMGALLVSPRGTYSFGHLPALSVVDGQQRLTTFQLFISALRDFATTIGESQTSVLLGSFLKNGDGPQVKSTAEKYKIYPTQYDRALFFDLMDLPRPELQKRYPESFYASGKVKSNAENLLRGWGYFREEAEEFAGAENQVARFEALVSALLEGFQVIVITLDDRDDAQTIFETLNAGGEPLAAMDLVRNDVFQRAARTGEDVESLLERRWKILETPFWKELSTRGRIRKPRIDFYLADTLTVESGEEILLTELYARYKNYIRQSQMGSVAEELEALLRFAPTFVALSARSDTSPLGWLGCQLSIFDVSTAYPLAFLVSMGSIDETEKQSIYTFIISYIVRRILCGLTAKNYNNVFSKLASQLKTGGVSLKAAAQLFEALSGDSARFPTDQELKVAIASRRQYGSIQQRRLRHILSALELALMTKFDEGSSIPDNLTIEHVLPEQWTNNYPLPDGTFASSDFTTGMSEAQMQLVREAEALKHTLGNLTLLTAALNPSVGNGSFEKKRNHFKHSLLKMNQDIAAELSWSADQIRKRAANLFESAITVWPYPK